MAPQRIQRLRVRDWSMPAGARYCGRAAGHAAASGGYGLFGNPFSYRTRNALARTPATDGVTAWEYENRISAAGMQHDYHWPNGDITQHTIRYMTVEEIVATHRRALIAPTRGLRLYYGPTRQYVDVDLVRRELAGLDLVCWCRLDRPCHADTLLWVANADEVEIKEAVKQAYDLIDAFGARVRALHPMPDTVPVP